MTLGNGQICKSNNGNILIANDGLIQEYDLSKNEYTTLVKDAVYLDEITKIFVCSQNNLWIATTNGIVLLNLKTNRYEYILHLKIAKEENIYLAEDYLGVIWFGCKQWLWGINRASDN